MKIIITFLFLLLITSPGFAFRYCFLNNDKVVQFAVDLMKNEGIPGANIDVWLHQVKEYNNKIEFYNSAKAGWKKSGDEDEFNKSSLIKGNFLNCRVGFFILAKDLIQVKDFTRIPQTKDNLDDEIVRMQKMITLSELDIKAFKSLFSPVDFPAQPFTMKSFDTAVKLYQAWWKKDGLKFPENKSLKIFQVVIVDPSQKTCYSDHAALIIEKSGKVYLIEKSGPFTPYVISEHSSYQELCDYVYSTIYFFAAKFKTLGIMMLANDEIVWKENK